MVLVHRVPYNRHQPRSRPSGTTVPILDQNSTTVPILDLDHWRSTYNRYLVYGTTGTYRHRSRSSTTSTIGHVYGDYELTCGVTRMRAHQASSKTYLSLQCRCQAVPLRAAAAYEARMMAMCHHPQNATRVLAG